MARIPLIARPLDLVYFVFFVSHIAATLCVDLQAFYPAHLTPQALKNLMSYYLTLTNDPTMTGVLTPTSASQFIWFKSLLLLEAFFQLPTFFLGAFYLFHNDRRVWLLLVIYGASTATTLVAVLGMVLAAPGEGEKGGVSATQRVTLLACYLPYLVLPLFMTVEVAGRIARLIQPVPVGFQGETKGKKVKAN